MVDSIIPVNKVQNVQTVNKAQKQADNATAPSQTAPAGDSVSISTEALDRAEAERATVAIKAALTADSQATLSGDGARLKGLS